MWLDKYKNIVLSSGEIGISRAMLWRMFLITWLKNCFNMWKFNSNFFQRKLLNFLKIVKFLIENVILWIKIYLLKFIYDFLMEYFIRYQHVPLYAIVFFEVK